MVCFDFDNPESFKDLDLTPDGLISKGAWVTETPKEPGRYHVVARDINDIETTREVKQGIERRVNTHYWLVYPSIHPNGKQYNLLNTQNPDELKLPKRQNTQEIWDSWIKILYDKRGIKEELQDKVKTKPEYDDSPNCIRNAWELGVKQQGMRYYTALALGSWLQQQKFPLNMAKSVVVEWFKTKCDTTERPITDIEKAVEVGYKGDKKYQTGCTYWRENTDFCPYDDKRDCCFYQPEGKRKNELLEKYEVFEKNEKGELTGRINCPRLAKLLMFGDGQHYIVTKDNQEIHVWNGSYYEPIGEGIIENRTSYYLDEQSTRNRKKEVIDFIKHYEYVEREELNPPINLINVKNGTYNIETKELMPHTYDYYFLYELPVTYDPKARIGKIQIFLGAVLYLDDLATLQEFFGDCLQRDYRYKKALMNVGPHDTGKSQVLGLLEKFLGENNTACVTLYDLCHDRFATIELYGKLANICADIGATTLKYTEKFKQITGGPDKIRGQKKHMSAFKFRNFGKLIFSCNTIPDSEDKTDAYYGRWIVIEYSNVFDGENCNPNILEEISTDEEMSGLLNWALDGLERLNKNRMYSEHRSLEEVKEFMQKHKKPIWEFTDSYITKDIETVETKEHVYNCYREYCKAMGYPIKESNVFSRQFKKYAPMGMEEGQSRLKGSKKTWKGIKCTWIIGDQLQLFATEKQREGK